MLFSQIEFFAFAAVVLLFLLLVEHHRAQKIVLLASSYYFYAYWDWRFLGLILTSTLVDYLVGRGLKQVGEDRPRTRRGLPIVSLVVNLGLLGFFKYYNFFAESLAAILEPLGLGVSTLHIILPVGISFYTFQTLSYTIDVYRNKLEPCDDFLDFALFVGFFPQLVAGPIVRAADFLPQLKTPRQMSWPHPAAVGLLAAIAVHHMLHRLGGPKVVRVLELREQRWYSPAVLMSMWWLIVVYYPSGPAPFIYFQF